MPRPSCLNCYRKHVAKAISQLIESRFGYPDHKWLAIGELAEAEAESLVDYPQLAIRAHDARKLIEEDAEYPDLMELIAAASAEESTDG